ncbi:MAG: hypothetical protein ABR913_06275 [Sedimentisphaerales bacterium]|jgi:hypothetical protein
MDLENDILNLKEESLGRIKNAVANRDVATISKESRRLEEIEKFEKQMAGIKMGMDRLNAFGPQNSETMIPSRSIRLMGRKRGRETREEIINWLRGQGKQVFHKQGPLYEVNGKLVGIAYASERPITPNKWWLGLKEAQYDSFVLICEDEYQKVTKFIFPKAFYEKYHDHFSKSENGAQIKFNIWLRDHRFTMQIPMCGDIPIDIYIDAFDNI